MTAPVQQVARRGFVAGFASRAIAYCIDAVVITIIVSLTSLVLTSLAQVLEYELPDPDRGGDAIVLATSVAGIAATYWFLGWWLFGKTVGKLAMGLRVVRADGERPRATQAALRVFGYFLSAGVFLMGFAWILVDGRRRGWHDHLARTYVVYDWDARPRSLLDLGDDEAIRPWV